MPVVPFIYQFSMAWRLKQGNVALIHTVMLRLARFRHRLGNRRAAYPAISHKLASLVMLLNVMLFSSFGDHQPNDDL